MPHKRAKRIVREQQRSEKGTDLAPDTRSLCNEAVPKSLTRVLNAERIRDDWRDKKRKREEVFSDGMRGSGKRRKKADTNGNSVGKGKTLIIQPEETLRHFNKRVEDDMRSIVKSAMKTSSAVSRMVRRAEFEANAQAKNKSKSKPQDHPSPEKHGHPKEFLTTPSSAPRRLNDVVQVPPDLTSLPRGAHTRNQKVGTGNRNGILSMAQKVMMETEREKAILHYREMKEGRRRIGLDVNSSAEQ